MPASSVKSESFGKLPTGETVCVFTLVNRRGMRLRAINYGAVVLSLEVPDRHGVNADVVLGFNTLEEYLGGSPYFGAVVGRFGNRIAGGRFTLDGETHILACNNTPGGIPCALHGGLRGFDKIFWEAEAIEADGQPAVRFSYTSPDGEEGYPGTLKVSVTYWLDDENGWHMDYAAITDKATPVNLTQHSFFNLRGEGNGDILDHEVSVRAGAFTPVNAGMIPTGEISPVAGTPLDFRQPVRIRERIEAPFEQIELGNGIDHNFVLDAGKGALALAATVYEPDSGRVLEVFTTEPGMQLYTGNFLDGSLTGKSGRIYGFREGLCLETQHFPDSPNHVHFPSTVLRPGETLRSSTVYRFSCRKE
jgi:aldose 1-epimerase